MSLVCLTSQKGAPGVTLSALVIAAVWPQASGRRKVLLEADPAGGALALRYGLGLETSLITLAVAARSGLDHGTFDDHLQELPGGLPAVVAPDGPGQVRAALQTSGPSIAAWLAESDAIDAIADLGRLTDANLPVSLAANAVLMVARPEVEQLQPAARRMAELAEQVPSVGWVVIGDRPHGPDEIQDTYGHPVVAVLPDDPRTARALAAGTMSARIMKSPLVRTAASVADDLAEWLHPEPVGAASEALDDADETVDWPLSPIDVEASR
jgi:MinD-like ATPase involved in chromosome partitioning or flagellar assembly